MDHTIRDARHNAIGIRVYIRVHLRLSKERPLPHHRKEITMTSLTQKFSTLALFLVVFGASTALAQSNDEQVPFTLTGTGVVTSVTHLPGGLTQINFNA